MWINDRFAPEPASGEPGESILEELAELSEAVRTGSYVATFWRDVSGAVVAKDLPAVLRKIRTEGFGYTWERFKRLRREHFVMAWNALVSKLTRPFRRRRQ